MEANGGDRWLDDGLAIVVSSRGKVAWVPAQAAAQNGGRDALDAAVAQNAWIPAEDAARTGWMPARGMLVLEGDHAVAVAVALRHGWISRAEAVELGWVQGEAADALYLSALHLPARFARTGKKKNADRGVDHLLLRSAYGSERRSAGAGQRGRQEAGRRRGWARRCSPRPGEAVPTAGTAPARRPRARLCGRVATSGAREADGADHGEARGPRGRRKGILRAAPHPSVLFPSAEGGRGARYPRF